jgi:hypothetical protein
MGFWMFLGFVFKQLDWRFVFFLFSEGLYVLS